MAYRADIDGLRAVAVLSVIAYHFGLPIPGGFTGVDVFFVISGFLITEKLFDDVQSDRFSILGFYDRRARRIIPALLVMMSATLILGNFLLWPGDYKALGASAAMAAFGASNFFFLEHTGYFDKAADLLPLLHTWSLAVEEQFYLAWPILFFAISKARQRGIIATIIGIITVAGFALCLWWTSNDTKSAFYMAIPRAWELTLGALLVFLPRLGRRTAPPAAAIGLALIGAGFYVAKADSFPSVAALYPCVGAALVLWPGRETNLISRTLGLVHPIGLISYSLYLWHWPAWVGFRILIENAMPSLGQAAGIFTVTLAISALSYRFVERPFRQRRWSARRCVFGAVACCTIVSAGGIYLDESDGRPDRIPRESLSMRSSDEMWAYQCPQKSSISYCAVGAPWDTATTRGLIWGDSHTLHLLPFLHEAARKTNTSITLFYACSPPLGGRVKSALGKFITLEGDDICKHNRQAGFDLIESHPEIEFVILASRWSAVLDQFYSDDSGVRSIQRGLELLTAETESAVKRITASGKQVVLVSDAPDFKFDPMPCATIHASALWRYADACAHPIDSIGWNKIEPRQGALDQAYAEIANHSDGVIAISLSRALCRTGKCLTYLNKEFLYRDLVHLRRNLLPETNAELGEILGFPHLMRQLGSRTKD